MHGPMNVKKLHFVPQRTVSSHQTDRSVNDVEENKGYVSRESKGPHKYTVGKIQMFQC